MFLNASCHSARAEFQGCLSVRLVSLLLVKAAPGCFRPSICLILRVLLLMNEVFGAIFLLGEIEVYVELLIQNLKLMDDFPEFLFTLMIRTTPSYFS